MHEASDDFIELMGRHLEEEGATRIAGRLFGLLMLEEGPCALEELAERLRVSKGSVSSNARLLEDWGIAERVTRPGDRRDFYQLAPDAADRFLNRQIARLELFIERMGRSREALAPLAPAVEGRFRRSTEFNRLAARALRQLRDDFRAGEAGQPD